MSELTIVEQLGIVAQSARCEFQGVLLCVCTVGLAATLLCLSVYAARNAVSRVLRLVAWLGPLGCLLIGPALVKLYVYASTKPVTHLWRFEYTNGVTDNGSYCSNDLICASWTYTPAAMEYTLRAAYQDLTITNALGQCVDSLHQLPDALVRDSSHVWTVQNATNMRVVVYAQYVPPPAVTTNGVYHVNGVMRSIDTTNSPMPKYVTPGVQIWVNLETGETEILTPTNRPPSVPLLQTINPQEETQE